jgi:hypothetical protein
MLRHLALGLAVLAVVVALVVRLFFDPASDTPSPPAVFAPEKKTEPAEEKLKAKAKRAGADDEEDVSESDSDNEPQEENENDENP